MEKFTYPTKDITIDLGDGRGRRLRYTRATLRRLKQRFGSAALAPETLQNIDNFPTLLFEGLVDREGIESPEALEEMILPSALMYLIDQFEASFTATLPSPDASAVSGQPSE